MDNPVNFSKNCRARDFFMNELWAGMMLLAIGYGAFHGTLPEVTQAVLDSAKEAVTLSMTMLGILSFWMGLMQISLSSGLTERLTRRLEPALQWLFPHIPSGHPALRQIALNCIANILGLGWAATPAGLKAMEELNALEEERRKTKLAVPEGTASDEMCTFLVLNISSLQLIPINVIAYRSQYGSVNPMAVTGPAIAATMISTVIAVLFCKIKTRHQTWMQ